MIATSGMAPSPTSREFTFLELFAGWAGFSGAVERVNAGSVLVLEPLEEYYGWDVLSESGFDQAKAAVLEASHVHIAFPCHSFTRARRSDQHGAVEQVRSDKHPEGWGHPVAEKGNAILVKAVALAWIALDNGATVSLENPWSSFAWEQVDEEAHEEAWTSTIRVASVCLWCGNPEADWHTYKCTLDGGRRQTLHGRS